jgi:hypothetical protein
MVNYTIDLFCFKITFVKSSLSISSLSCSMLICISIPILMLVHIICSLTCRIKLTISLKVKNAKFLPTQRPTAMYQHRCLNISHLTISLILSCLWYVIFVLPCEHIYISCFYVSCLLPALRSFVK